MATDAVSSGMAGSQDSTFFSDFATTLKAIAKPVASLRFTVALFAFSVALIFIGTLAQAQPGMNMWRVIDKYFRSGIVMVNMNVFLVPGWFPNAKVPDWMQFPFPGGFTIGVAMAVNLLAAHLVRFKIQAKGPMLLFGGLLLIFGTVITYFVIVSGQNANGLQGRPPFEWPVLWYAIRACLVGCACASVLGLAMASNPTVGKRVLYLSLTAIFGGLSIWAWKMMPSEPSLRILWQLVQGGLSGLILLAGCWMVFQKRAGIVLLHAGILLMMFSEFFVSKYAEEGHMTIREGETVNYVEDTREVEIAIVDPSEDDVDSVVVVPGSMIRPERSFWRSSKNEKPVVKNESLPFDIYVEQYFGNSDLVKLKGDEGKDPNENFADAGFGTQFVVVPLRESDGTDSSIDFASVYVELKKKGSDETLGRHLLTQHAVRGDTVDVDGKTYEVSLRFKREYRPYKLSLKDVRKDDYVGTDMPMNYSSDVVLTKTAATLADNEGFTQDNDSNVGDFHIWMNNPLRYSGETFYQSGYGSDRGGGETTTLQVVQNKGWMMPYIGCMLVSVGMAFHFCGSLWRFLEKSISQQVAASKDAKTGWVEVVIPFALVILFGAYSASKFRPPKETKSNMQIHEFGKLPVVYKGRVKPMDSLARNTLRIVSNREYVRVAPYDNESMFGEVGTKRPAIEWLLDVISGSPAAADHRVFRIDNLDVQKTLGLPRRKRFRYSLNEFRGKLDVFQKQVSEARALPVEELSLYQKKLVELEGRIRILLMLQASFIPEMVPDLPSSEDFAANPQQARQQMMQSLAMLKQKQAALERMEPPLSVPTSKDSEWLPFTNSWETAFVSQMIGQPAPEPTVAWAEMLRAYGQTEVNEFNEAVIAYAGALEGEPPTIKNAKGEFDPLNFGKLRFEHFFNSSQPFTIGCVLYVIAFVLVAIGWAATSLGKSLVFQRSAFLLIILAFVIHSLALGARIYISGRPPITNLYSSAIFIGWAAVLLGLAMEVLYRRGIGNALATISGFSTLLIAYSLAADGDTFTVLRAVLDTQFWLATHVVCITIGYSTTFVAGLIGLLYVLSFAWKKPELAKSLTSMTYGTLCFALFFSFVGTVLGGLWADDSWGRFWGWDPKENGALMIVLWNALVLHARWGGMARQKGIALLAIGGNIITAWSWFGVNELGVGLHSYGFTDGVLKNLSLFVLSQLLVIGLGLVLIRSSGSQKLAA